MTEATMIVPFGNGDFFANSHSTREALARWAKAEFRSRKELACALDLTEVQARSVMEGAATWSTIDQIWRHPRGGPRVALTVMRAVIGSGLDRFIAHEFREIADGQHRLEEDDRNAKALWARALAGPAPADRGGRLADPEARRESRGSGRLDRSRRAQAPDRLID